MDRQGGWHWLTSTPIIPYGPLVAGMGSWDGDDGAVSCAVVGSKSSHEKSWKVKKQSFVGTGGMVNSAYLSIRVSPFFFFAVSLPWTLFRALVLPCLIAWAVWFSIRHLTPSTCSQLQHRTERQGLLVISSRKTGAVLVPPCPPRFWGQVSVLLREYLYYFLVLACCLPPKPNEPAYST